MRPFRCEDLNELISIGEASHEEGNYRYLSFSKESVEDLGKRILQNPQIFCCFVAEHEGEIAGVIVGFIGPYWFSTEKFASDMIVYVAPKYRGTSAALRLISEFEKWGRSQGIHDVKLGISTGINVEATSRFYQKLGYEYVGPMFSKKVS